MNQRQLVGLCLSALLPLAILKPVQAQSNWAVYGTQFASSGTNLRIMEVRNPNLASATMSTAIDVAGFTNTSGIVGAPGGTSITGTSLNSAAWDQTNKRLYFRDNAGQGNLYYWQRGATTINYVASAATIMPSASSLMADNASIYNGGYFYLEDKTDTLSRYDLTAGTVRRFTGISGATGRLYDFGDIAVSTSGILYINGPSTTGSNMVLDKVDISSITASGGSTTGFANIVDYGANFAGKTQQIAFDHTGTRLYSIQSLAASGSAATTFAAQTWHEINLTTGAQTATIWTSSSNLSDLGSGFSIPEPATLALFLPGLLILRRRKL